MPFQSIVRPLAICLGCMSCPVVATAQGSGPPPGYTTQQYAWVKLAQSASMAHPRVTIPVDAGKKLVGGGGFADWLGAGSLLDRIRPVGAAWEASSKDHAYSDPARLTGYLIQLDDATNRFDVRVVETVSPVSTHPTVRATLPAGYVLAGGGCLVDWRSTPEMMGNLLTGSYPDEVDRVSWICEAKQHLAANPAAVRAYVVGIRARSGLQPLLTITKATSAVGAAPRVQAMMAPHHQVTGGGARAEVWRAATIAGLGRRTGFVRSPTAPPVRAVPDSGVLLTGSFPVLAQGSSPLAAIGWEARGKDHGVSSPGTVTAYVVALFLPAPPPPPPPPPATCFCTATGPFAPAAIGPISGGLQGTFNHPTDGQFTVTPQLVGNQPNLSVTDAQGGGVLSVADAVAWGLSPGNRFFVVVNSLVGPNAGSPLTLYRVARRPTGFRSVVSTDVWPDGKWGFSPDGSQLLIERFEQAPIRYSLTSHNLLAANPITAVLRTQESSVFGPSVTMSPCGDRLLYHRWTQLNPRQGQLDFYARKDFPALQSVIADWDGMASGMSAQVEAGTTMNSFVVRLFGAQLRSNGQTTFPSRQCEAP
ncbi:MAG: hypothetical protein ACKVZ0_22965 [Gemmatimonadales bacterium]